MHAALWKLYRLRIRGTFRTIAGKFKSRRGAAMAVFTLVVFGFMLGPNLLLASKLGRARALDRSADWLFEAIPAAMFLLVVLNVATSLGERALYFSPSEVDFLFPAPFSRRQILVYKIVASVAASAFMALIIPVSLAMYVRSWTAAAVGGFLGWLMMNSLTMCAQLIAQTVGERAFTRARKFVLGGVLAAAAVALVQAAGQGLNGSWQETLLRARHSILAQILLAPFVPFAKIIGAERLVPDALGWAAVGAIAIVVIYALAIRLDANYLETAVRVSQQIQKRRQRAMTDGVFASQVGTLRSSRLPLLPWWGGAGPLIWRQMVQALRGGRRGIFVTAISVLAVGFPLAVSLRHSNALPKMLPHVIIGVAAYVTILYSAQAQFGFRGDYERMDLLKSLPIGPMAMAFGQTVVVVLFLTVLQWSVFAATAIFLPAATLELFAAGLLILPVNWICCGMEDFLFLLYPSPPVLTGSEGFLKMGRVMLFMLAKFLALGICVAMAAIPALVGYLISGSLLAAFAVGWLTLFLPSTGLLMLVAWAFQRYAVATDVSE